MWTSSSENSVYVDQLRFKQNDAQKTPRMQPGLHRLNTRIPFRTEITKETSQKENLYQEYHKPKLFEHPAIFYSTAE
jgi:hypothetical protein